MGTFSVSIGVGDPEGRRFVAADALVDTGATFLSMPRGTLSSLGIPPVERASFMLASGESVEYDIGLVSLRLAGRTLPVFCVLGDEGSEPLLGAIPLESFRLSVDPVSRQLVSVPGRLMGQHHAAEAAS